MMRKSASGLSCRWPCILLSGCGYNSMQAQDEQIKSSWSEVVNQYQRRADLDPESGGDRERLRHAGTTACCSA